MDFSTLVAPYCSSEALQTFIDGLNNKAVSSFLINPKCLTESSKAVLDSLGRRTFGKDLIAYGRCFLHPRSLQCRHLLLSCTDAS